MIHGKLWLIEEHVTETPYGGAEKIQWRKIVTSENPHLAFLVAEQYHREDRNHGMCFQTFADPGGYSFAFGDDDLMELVKGFLWCASDGSSIWYEVRFLGTLEINMNWGSEDFGSLKITDAIE
jgi:hypothetical protein